MMWLTWRQFRTQAIVTIAGLVLVAIVLVITGLQLAHRFDATGITGCHPHTSCEQIANAFLLGLKGTVPNIVLLIAVGLTYLVPGLIGVFWGAPLITREIETGTFKLAWTQSVTRRRWLAVKVGLIGLTAVAAAGLLSLMLGWWARPLFMASAKAGSNSSKIDRILPVLFGVNGVAPIGYAAFGFALGLAFGVLIRRTLPAMAATLAVFAAIQVAWPLLVRPHLIPALRGTMPITASNIVALFINPGRQMFVTANAHKPGAWIISNQTVDAAGHAFTGPATQACLSGSQSGCFASVVGLHLRSLITYQPASRFWALQGFETAIFLAIAVALVWYCFRRVGSRRLT
jgi:ABC-type transport system involved in multi-copper enzyme maturation permease subunit